MVDIDLEKLGRFRKGAELLNATSPDCRYAEHRTQLVGGLRQSQLTLMVKQTLHGSRGHEQRKAQPLTQDFYGHVDFVVPCQHVRYQIAAIERFGVSPQSDFVIRATVDVMKYWRRQSPLRQLTEIFGLVTVLESQFVLMV